MIELVGLIGLVAFVGASLVVGGRILMLATRTRQLPETAIGLSLLLAGGVGTGFAVFTGVFPDLGAGPIFLIDQIGSAANHVGWALLYVFVWRVFRPREVWAACLFAVATATLFVGGIGTAVSLEPGGGIPGRTSAPDLWFWTSLASRFFVYSWTSFESFHYYSMLKRRLALGLAQESVVNRFFYWGVCTSAVVCIWLNLGIRAVLLESEAFLPISNIVSALLGFAVAGSLSYAFFPSSERSDESDRTASATEDARP